MRKIKFLLLCILSCLIVCSCGNDPVEEVNGGSDNGGNVSSEKSVTGRAYDITDATAKVECYVNIPDEMLSVSSFGALYSTKENPMISDCDGSVSSSELVNNCYSVKFISLRSSTTYYYRSYVRIGENYVYGKVKTFTTDVKTTHEYVDLGLPSGTLWATCNIGAENPEDYGDYFAWGETTGYNNGKKTFNWSTYTLCNGSYYTMTKYCTRSSDGTVDNKTELDPEDDAAYVNWGSDWRIPTLAQLKELFNSSYTTITWTTLNGVYGRKISKKSDSSVYIFLPAAGYRYDSSLSSAGSFGDYWSRSLDTSDSRIALSLQFHSDYISKHSYIRCYGRSVRPVFAK